MAPLAVAFPWKPGPYQEAMPVWLIRPSEAGDGGSLTLDGGREQAARNNNGGRNNRVRACECNIVSDRLCRIAGSSNTDRRIIAEAEEKRKKEIDLQHLPDWTLIFPLCLRSMTRITTVRPA